MGSIAGADVVHLLKINLHVESDVVVKLGCFLPRFFCSDGRDCENGARDTNALLP